MKRFFQLLQPTSPEAERLFELFENKAKTNARVRKATCPVEKSRAEADAATAKVDLKNYMEQLENQSNPWYMSARAKARVKAAEHIEKANIGARMLGYDQSKSNESLRPKYEKLYLKEQLELFSRPPRKAVDPDSNLLCAYNGL